MTMFNYESEDIYKQVRGETQPSSPVYVAECKKEILEEVSPNYPQLVEYEKEWLNFAKNIYHDGTPVPLEYQEVETDEYATVNNAIPFYYKSAILKGSTKYRDIDTGEVLDAFEDGRNLELVSVKMPVLKSTGKNLCDNLKNKLGEITTDGKEHNVSTGIISDYINFTYGEHYSGSVFQNGIRLGGSTYRYYDKNKSYLGTTPTENAKFVRLRYYNGSIITLDDYYFQYEKGNITSYEPFKSTILTVNEPVELRGIGDVKDELNLITGELTQRIGEIVFDGSNDERWKTEIDSTSGARRFDTDFISGLFDGVNTNFDVCKLMSNQYKTVSFEDVFRGISNGIASYQDNYIVIHDSDCQDLDSFLAKTRQNPITLYYILKSPIVKTVDLSTSIRPYNDINHYHVSSDTIPPHLSLSVPVVSTGAQTLNDIITEG